MSKRFKADQFLILAHDDLLLCSLNISICLVDQLKEFVERLGLPRCDLLEIDISAIAKDLSEEVLSLLFVEQVVLPAVCLSVLVYPL